MRHIEIAVAGGLVALIDADDFELVKADHWAPDFQRNTTYVRRHFINARGVRTNQYLHTLLTGWAMVDHINGDGLDNRRTNLRPVTHVENARNMRKTRGASQYKGVSRSTGRTTNIWRARIKLPAGELRLGAFANEADAARAYDTAARELFGEFAALNFPRPGERSAR